VGRGHRFGGVARRRRGGVCVSPQEARGSVRIRSSSRGDSRAFVGRKFFFWRFLYRTMENEAPEQHQEPKKKHELTEARRAALAKARVKAYEVRLQNKALRDKERAAQRKIAEKVIRDNEARIEALAQQAEGNGETEEAVEAHEKSNPLEEEEDESEVEEVIEERVTKKKKPKKKPVRRRVIVVEESDSEDALEEEEEITEVKIPKAKAVDRSAGMVRNMFSL